MTKSAAAYYIRIDTYWQHSPDRWVGPFASRKQAEGAIGAALNAEDGCAVMSGQRPQDIKRAIRVYGVFPKSHAERMGMRDASHYPKSNLIGHEVPINIDELFEKESAGLSY